MAFGGSGLIREGLLYVVLSFFKQHGLPAMDMVGIRNKMKVNKTENVYSKETFFFPFCTLWSLYVYFDHKCSVPLGEIVPVISGFASHFTNS